MQYVPIHYVMNRNKHLLEKSWADWNILYWTSSFGQKMVLEWNSIKYRLSPWKELSRNPMKIQFSSLTNLINKCWSCLSPFKVLSGKTNSSSLCIFLQSPVNEHLSYFWHLQSNLESSMDSTAAIYFLQRLIVPVLLKDECRSPFQTSCSGLL